VQVAGELAMPPVIVGCRRGGMPEGMLTTAMGMRDQDARIP
jgi:hypothetical protein